MPLQKSGFVQKRQVAPRRLGARAYGTKKVDLAQLWPPGDNPVRRRIRFGQNVERMKADWALRRGHHVWVPATVGDLFPETESFHAADRFEREIRHAERFQVARIPAIVELCIQAGVDVPEHPTVRRTAPIRFLGRRKYVLEHERDDQSHPRPPAVALPPTIGNRQAASPLPPVGGAGEQGRGAGQLREGGGGAGEGAGEEVGAVGGEVQLCGAKKHQWRKGMHGWQPALLDDIVPPVYVWHVRDPAGPPLQGRLRAFYGMAPAVVELCTQAGVEIPEKYEQVMRLRVVVPDDDELELFF
eukprot:jgi/Mesen1/3516/ME000197S02540